MSDFASPKPSTISLEDLIALNDEIASLARAGVPLEIGLHGFAGGTSGRLADISTTLSERLRNGESVQDALASEHTRLPRVYRAIVEAGVKAGRLPEALQAVTGYAQSLLDVRRRISLAMIYPCIVLVMAYYLFGFFIGLLSPTMQEMYRLSENAHSPWLSLVTSAHEIVVTAGHIPPLILGVCVLWWLTSSQFFFPTSGIAGVGLRWFPGLGGVLRRFHLSTFSELTAMLLEHEVPLHDALRLAAEATGDKSIIHDAERLAVVVERGEPLFEGVLVSSKFPPFMRWMLRTGDRQGALVPTLRQLAERYRRNALDRAEWFKILLPVLLTLVVGGSAVLLYILALFLPLLELFRELVLE